MSLIRCPEILPLRSGKPSLFLGGGITNCPDWQSYITEDLLKLPDLDIVNPRRADFDSSDGNIRPQIEWERDHLNRVDATLFWFPCETLCPITLFELGNAAARRDEKSTIFVGCHKRYARREDVIIQLSLLRPEVKVVSYLDELIANVRQWYFD